jgi:hypothetical protein
MEQYKQTLFNYRLKQAEETLSDVEKMLHNNLSPRSVINRAYYSMFYAVIALFLKDSITIKTSKHSGVISSFDKEFVHTGKIDKRYSRMLHKMFNLREKSDYKELVVLSAQDAEDAFKTAKEFLEGVTNLLDKLDYHI